MTDKPSKTPYLRFGEAARPIMGPALEIIGNAKALLQLRRQIDRALGLAEAQVGGLARLVCHGFGRFLTVLPWDLARIAP